MTDETVDVHAPAIWKKIKRWQIILAIVILASFVRIWAAWQLPVDADEPTYSRAGQFYAQAIQAGSLPDIINYADNKEHPPLVKLIYSLPYLFIEPHFGLNVELIINRLVSALFGVLAVWILALLDPLAGFFLAMDSMTIKYTSEVYLEALPLFAIVLSVFLLKKSKDFPENKRWWIGSSILLGTAVAGKYLYGLVIFPLALIMLQKKQLKVKQLPVFCAVALATFLMLNPYLWVDPFNRLWNSVFFHVGYTQGSNVLRASYPWYQPLNWIKMSVPWHAKVFFFPTLDVLVFFLAIIGLWPSIKKRLWAIIWAISSLAVLLLWPTKWPQYILVLKPALCLLAATGFYFALEKARNFEATWHWAENVLPRPTKLFWVTLIIFCVVTSAVYVSYQVSLAQARLGWTEILAEFSPLPSNTTYDLKNLANNRIAIGTDNGVAIWEPSNVSPWGDAPRVFSPENSPLPGWNIYSILPYGNGAFFATERGLAFWDGADNWKVNQNADLGLLEGKMNSLAMENDRFLWMATSKGAIRFGITDASPQAFSVMNSGLPSDSIFSVAVQSGKAAWFGSLKGVTRYDLITKVWQTYDLSQFGTSWGGVIDLFVDAQGQIAVGTLGAGLAIGDEKSWQNFRLSNSDIPQNNVNLIIQDDRNNYWLGLSYSTTPGGLIARFDGQNWQSFSPSNSGYTGNEPVGLAFDSGGRLWIATHVTGLQVYQNPPK